MKFASWNVNSVNARLPRILDWFDEARPDVCVLQETKCVDDKFPFLEFEDRGYNVESLGQKTYNGVALLSKYPLDDVRRGLPGFRDENSRYIEALVMPEGTEPVRMAGIYLPNGNPAPGEKYDYKLAFMAALRKHTTHLLAEEESFILAGDYNVIPQAEDCYDPPGWLDDALFMPKTREAFRELLYLGLTDALRSLKGGEHFYTSWDYKAGAWPKDHGIRIDHLLLSPQAADRLTGGGVDKQVREPNRGDQSVKPSDHVPVWVTLS